MINYDIEKERKGLLGLQEFYNASKIVDDMVESLNDEEENNTDIKTKVEEDSELIKEEVSVEETTNEENNESVVEDDEDFKEMTDEELELTQKEINDYANNLEINNLEAYKLQISKEIEKINIELNKEDITEEYKDNLESIKSNFDNMLEKLSGLYDLNYLKDFHEGKFKKEKYIKAKNRTIEKLDNHPNLTFTNPVNLEYSLKLVLDEETANRFLLKIYMWINTCKMNTFGVYIYFLILALSSLPNTTMKHREEMINTIKSIYN